MTILHLLLTVIHLFSGDPKTPERMTPVARAIQRATTSTEERAFLLAQGEAESHFAAYVLEGRCYDGPKGARCDEGKATGPWQVHAWCRAAPSDFEGQARCVLRAYRAGKYACGGSISGALNALAGLRCTAKPWTARVNRILELQRMLSGS